MKYTDVIGGVFGTALGAVLTIIGWLLWPLPSVEFEWQAHADALSTDEGCHEFVGFLQGVIAADPIGVAAYVEEQSILSRCPQINTNSESYGFEVSAVVTDQLYDSLDFETRRPDLRASWGLMLDEGYAFWQTGRELRGTFIAWPDLVLGFRCHGAVGFGNSSHWYAAQQVGERPAVFSPQLPTWDRRTEWCSSYALAKASKLDGDLSKMTLMQLPTGLQELARNYRLLANSLSPLE